jgi:hypothetical protein
VALKDVIGSRGRSQVTWLACGTVSFHAAFRQVGVADCDCGLGLHGTLMRGGMERIGGIGGLGLISGKT